MPWVKVYIEMLDDVKVSELTDSQKWRFIQLILYAAECDAGGALVTGESPVTHNQVTWRLRCDKNELESDLEKMAELGLITDDGVVSVVKFTDRQGPTQAEKRKQWQKRQENRRLRIKSNDVTRESRVTHADVTTIEEEKIKTINNVGAKAPTQAQSELRERRSQLTKYFMQKTGLPMFGGNEKTKQKLWWSPADEIFKLAGEDMDRAKEIIDRAIYKMGNLTISDMNSIIKTARAVYSEDHRPDTHQYVEVE